MSNLGILVQLIYFAQTIYFAFPSSVDLDSENYHPCLQPQLGTFCLFFSMLSRVSRDPCLDKGCAESWTITEQLLVAASFFAEIVVVAADCILICYDLV